MKQLTVGTFVGLVIGLPIIYWLRPLNNGAMALILLLCVGAVTAAGALIRSIRKTER